MKGRNDHKLSKKSAALFLIVALVAGTLTACGDSEASGQSSDGEVQKILVGVPTNFENTSFLDEDGELKGYEIDLLTKIDEKLDNYEFEFQQSQFDNILLSLDSGKIDMGAHMFEYSEERAQKYLYGDEGYRDFSVHLIAMKGSGYTTLESLAGKTIGIISETDNAGLQIQKYNEKNPEKAIHFDYYGEGTGTDVIMKTLEEGRWEAVVGTQSDFEQRQETFGDKYELGETVTESEAYYLYPDDGEHEALKDAVDQAVKELKEDGTLNELAEEWYGTPAYYN